MSFDLGNWAEQLQCDMCGGLEGPNLGLPEDPLPELGGLPDGFWDDPPDPAEGFEFDVPDFYPYLEFPDGGFLIGIHGEF